MGAEGENEDPRDMCGFPKLGNLIGGPHNKDCSILESMLWSPYFGKLPYVRIVGKGCQVPWPGAPHSGGCWPFL